MEQESIKQTVQDYAKRFDLPRGFGFTTNQRLIVPDHLKDDRPTINISGPVEPDLFEKVSREIIKLKDNQNLKELNVILSTHGGKVYFGFGIHDMLSTIAKEKMINVNIKSFGPVMSMGALILQAGTNRAMAENATMLIHPFKTSGEGYIDTLLADNQQTFKMNGVYAELMARRVKMAGGTLNANSIRKMMRAKQNSGTFLSSTEALKLKLIDTIL